MSMISVSPSTYGLADSPYGPCLLAERDQQLVYLGFLQADDEPLAVLTAAGLGQDFVRNDVRARQLADRVFAGEAVPTAPQGTAFQRAVWEALQAIPAGETRTYADIARTVGRPRATRAVGTAIGRNPLAWLIPCHRVIRQDGSLGGFRWGLPLKRRLLAEERVQLGAA